MSHDSARISNYGCLTALGDAVATHAALLRGERALKATPVRGKDGGDAVPLALIGGRKLEEGAPPEWLAAALRLLEPIRDEGWGSARRPVFVTGSNFGVGSLHSYLGDRDPAHLGHGSPGRCVEVLRRETGWGPNVCVFSLACVSAHLGLLQASRIVDEGLADKALVFSFDFLSPFVTGGFHALKILNTEYPAPYQDRPSGAIGLGDGMAYAVLAKGKGDFVLSDHSLHNEMHHFTANRADGAGFDRCLTPIAHAAQGRRLWVKGHGTGTLEAGRLESGSVAKLFPDARLVGWKGSLGHTLGSCGLVELGVVLESLRSGRAPGTVGSQAPSFMPNVALDSFDCSDTDTAACVSNAFGGAHAAFLVSHA